jgi:hypothetical protein
LTKFWAAIGLAIGYVRMGFAPGFALVCGIQDDAADIDCAIAGCSGIALIAGLTRRYGVLRRAVLLLGANFAWFLLLASVYSMDAKRRGLDITWGLHPASDWAVCVLVSASCLMLLHEIRTYPAGHWCNLLDWEQSGARETALHPPGKLGA